MNEGDNIQPCGTTTSGALESAQTHLAGSTQPNRAESSPAGRARQLADEFRSLVKWAQACGRLITADSYMQPDELGAEHRVYYRADRHVAIKVTNTGRCGMTYIKGQSESALPHEYLERWRLHNHIFGDDVELEGLIQTPAGISLVVSQRWIAGTVPEDGQIDLLMRGLGFVPTDYLESYYNTETGIAVLDCHDGNFILGNDGRNYPIDVIPLVPDSETKQLMGLMP